MNFLSPMILISTFTHRVLSQDLQCNMTFAVDNEAIFYVDGVQYSDLINWPQSRNVIFPCYSSVIAIHAWNVEQSPAVPVNTAAFIGSSDNDYIMTNTSWKCSNVLYPGWTSVDYDDSFWSNPTSYGTRDEYTNGHLFRNTIKPNAHWIWLRQFRQDSSSNPFKDMDVIIYCRKTLRKLLRVCYVSNSAQNRPSPATFLPDSIDPSLCTHINLAYAVIDTSNNIKPKDNDDVPGGLYEKTLALRNKQPGLKVLLAVGGGNFGMGQVSKMLSSSSTRSTFINSSISLLRSKGFDGVAIDFMYPASRGSPATDKHLFTSFLQELRTAINNEATSSGKTALLLTAAVAAKKVTVDAAYEIPLISQSVDFLNLMTYDFNGAWDTITGLNSPLIARSDEYDVDFRGEDRSTRNLAWAAEYWVDNGAPKDKLVLGLALYGRCFTLANVSQNGLGAPVTGPCQNGTYSVAPGFLSYYEICGLINNGATQVYSSEQHAQYAYLGNQWVGYDGTTSLADKVEYIIINYFGGWHARDIDLDDFSGSLGCNAGPYPLLSFMSQQITRDKTTSNQPRIASTTKTTQKDIVVDERSREGCNSSSATVLAVLVGIMSLVFLILLILICLVPRRRTTKEPSASRESETSRHSAVNRFGSKKSRA